MTTNGLSDDELRVILDRLDPEDRALWDAMGEAVPRWTCWPRAGAQHELPALDATARALGTPLMPWQRWWGRLATERLERDPRRYQYPDEVVTVPRQSGKTTGVRTMLACRGLRSPYRQAYYTAQTGKDAVQRWGDLVQALDRSPLAQRVHKRAQTGSERLTLLDTQSTIAPFPPTADSLHGYTPADIVLDECFSFTVQEGVDLIGACKPAQQTLPDRKLVRLSTMGDRRSEWWNSEVAKGREATGKRDGRLLFLEWSIADDADPYDEEAWRFHPALGHTIDLDDLREAAAAVPYSEWVRAYCNRVDDTDVSVLDVQRWADATTPLDRLKISRCAVGYQMAPDRSRFSAVAAWRLPDGRVALRTVIDHQTPERAVHDVVRLWSRHPLALAADDSGSTRVLTADAGRRIADLPDAPFGRDPVRTLRPRDYSAASLALKAAIDDGLVAHGVDDVLDEAVRGAVSKRAGEWWTLSHASPPAVIAAAIALHALQAQPATAPLPEIVFA